ncbi:hypothetical protein AALO_G00082260 [Alosa alosa]|uniref:Transmembrane protein 238-like n=1 Tax=Alosa alosa TaxID=278164 RepID=A0AAV6H1K6_9TELE|nr:hypothetical protein AALO_G00082260 [Alosa alosa]
MDCKACCGRCILFLVLAVICDVVGLVLFLVGILAPLSFWDLFVLSGPLVIFLSLVFWIFWYLGNLTVPYKELVKGLSSKLMSNLMTDNEEFTQTELTPDNDLNVHLNSHGF